MCYQGAIEAINAQYETLPENIKTLLSRGGGRLKSPQILEIHTALLAGNCTEFDLVGIMENTIMKVMANLQRDYNFVVEPTEHRVRNLAVAEPLTAIGWNIYTENGPVSSWGVSWRIGNARPPTVAKAPVIGSPRKKSRKGKTFTEDSYVETPEHARPSYEVTMARKSAARKAKQRAARKSAATESQSSRPAQEKAAAAIKRSLKIARAKELAAAKAKLAKYKGDDDGADL